MEKVGKLLERIEIAPDWQKRGYVALSNKILYNKKLSNDAKVLFWYLLTRAFGKDNCFPSNSTIMKDLKVKRRETIIKYKKELLSEGLIKIKRRGNHKTNVYILKS